MMGGGFGGCAIALVAADRWEGFAASVAEGYLTRTGKTATLYRCRATDGASLISRA
jgi:galactokinase